MLGKLPYVSFRELMIMRNLIESKIRSAMTGGVELLAAWNRKRMPALPRENPYLSGIHRPMNEEKTLLELDVNGQIPESLNGQYLRIGPNPLNLPDPNSYHWFLGDGMAHGVRIEGGKALWYRNRWIRSNAVSKALGEPTSPGSRNPRADNANTNIIRVDGRTFAIVEAGGFPVEVDSNLETIQHTSFDSTLGGSFSAHPHLDPETGQMHAICYDAMVKDTVWHVVLGADAKVVRREPIAVKDGPSIHDCAITKTYVLVFDLPVTFSMRSVIAGHGFPYKWNPKHQARVGLCPRSGRGDQTIWFDVDPCYVFHPANAYETDKGDVIVDVIAHETMFATSTIGPDSRRSRLERWTLKAGASQVERRVLHDHNQEFPRYNESYTCHSNRYIYSVSLPMETTTEMLSMSGSVLFKNDLQTGEVSEHDFGVNRHLGEFVFVSKTDRSGKNDKVLEDDGWLMGFVIDSVAEVTDLVILGAQDISAAPLAAIRIPHTVPPGFHGNWV